MSAYIWKNETQNCRLLDPLAVNPLKFAAIHVELEVRESGLFVLVASQTHLVPSVVVVGRSIFSVNAVPTAVPSPVGLVE